MPSPLVSIKEYILTHPADEVRQQLPRWHEQLKQQGISSMALQALLSHFSQEKGLPTSTDASGYILPGSIITADEKELNRLRQEVSDLKSRHKRLESEAKRLRSRVRALVGALVGVSLVTAFLLVLCCQG